MAHAKPVPDGYHSVQPYLIVKDCAKAIDFYTNAFGATERLRLKSPDGWIGHAEIEIGDCCVMMADEHPEVDAYSPGHYGGTAISLHVYVEDCDATYRRALAAGAKSIGEPADQFYGDRVCGVLDPFGHKWFLSTHIKDVSPDEMKKAFEK